MGRILPKLRWNENCFHPFESVWSILHKLSHWNSLTPYDLDKLFWKPSKKYISSNDAEGASAWYPYSIRKVGELLRIPDAHLVLAEAKPYRFDLADWKIEESAGSIQSLRYCPKCISLGFHSARFQMPWIQACPIHRIELVDSCPSCDTEIPYRCDWESLSFAYGCSECGRALWADRDSIPTMRTISDNDLAIFSKSFFDEKSFDLGPAQDRALFCTQPTPFRTSNSNDTLFYAPGNLLQASGATNSDLAVYRRSDTHIYDRWDVLAEGLLGLETITRSSGYHPQYRTMLPRHLKPNWRTKVRSEWVEAERQPWGMNFPQKATYIQEGFRRFARDELLSAHKECFRSAIDCDAMNRPGNSGDSLV